MKVLRHLAQATRHDLQNGVIVQNPEFVYVVLSADKTLVKVGTSSQLADRLNQLLRQYPGITYLGHTPGGEHFEGKVHTQIAAERVKGEWFRASPPVLRYLKTLGLDKRRPLFYALFTEGGSKTNSPLFAMGKRIEKPRATELPWNPGASLKNIGKNRAFSGGAQRSAETVAPRPRRKVRDLEDSMYLERGEIEAFFGVITSKRDRAIFRLAYHRGLRAHEIGLLRLEDFKERDGLLYIRRGKGSICRDHSLTDLELRPLRFWLKERGFAPGPLFPSRQSGGNLGISRFQLSRLMKEYCQQAGIRSDKAHMHALKHSCGTHLREMGAAADEIQDWLGHRDSGSTDIYMHFTKARRAEMADRLRLWK